MRIAAKTCVFLLSTIISPMSLNLDKTDIAILTLLQKDSTMPVKEIARQVGLSPTPTYERVKWLEESGTIQRYVALVDRPKTGLHILVFCNIVLKEQSKEALVSFESAMQSLPEVLEVFSVSGTYDYMLKVVARDLNAYNAFIMNVIANTPNVGQYHSSIVLSEVKRETALPL